MGSLKVKEVISNIQKKGFKEAINKSIDHKWFEFWHEGKLTRARTKFSHGEKEIGDSLISLIARQLYLTGNQFKLFVQCDISYEQYAKILKEKGFIK